MAPPSRPLGAIASDIRQLDFHCEKTREPSNCHRAFAVLMSNHRDLGSVSAHEPADAGRVFLRASERRTADANAWLSLPLVAPYLLT